jgi:hypothetical protein
MLGECGQETYNLGLKRQLSFKTFNIYFMRVCVLVPCMIVATCMSDAYGFLKRVVGMHHVHNIVEPVSWARELCVCFLLTL